YSPNATGSTVYNANQPNDVTWRWPAFYNQLARLDAAFDYTFAKNWTAKFFYAYESFVNADWQTGALTPALTPNGSGSIFLGQHCKNSPAQILGVPLKYRFECRARPRRPRRPRLRPAEGSAPHWGRLAPTLATLPPLALLHLLEEQRIPRPLPEARNLRR